MPDTTETANLDLEIEALLSKASDLLRRQLDDVRRNAQSAYDQEHDVLPAA